MLGDGPLTPAGELPVLGKETVTLDGAGTEMVTKNYDAAGNIVEKMNAAAQYLLGTHDFSCFEKTGTDNVSSVCTVTGARWAPYTPTHVSLLHYPAEEGDYLYFRVTANRFLRNMVRAIVGSLIEVGRGRREPEWIASLLDGGGDRGDAGESVPGHALFLSGVGYPDD